VDGEFLWDGIAIAAPIAESEARFKLDAYREAVAAIMDGSKGFSNPGGV